MQLQDKFPTILANLGIDSWNEMQKEAHSAILDNENTILLSPTGSGKTLAFLLPVLQILQKEIRTVQCLVIVPSRELGLQIEHVWRKMGTGYKANVCYGGHAIETELKNLSNPPALLIGTPGRLLDHLDRKSFATETISTLVLDEFDKSLQLGFQEDMEAIIERLPNINKKVLLSATSDVEIPAFVRVNSPAILNYGEGSVNENLSLRLVLSPEKDKIDALFRLICSLDSEPALIFCNHREVVERMHNLLKRKGIQTGFYHGGMEQEERERVLIRFRNGSLNYLITTDLAARGLDIPEMKHVVHYNLPSRESEFIHRNGRTARMEASGTAYVILYREDILPAFIPQDTPVLKIAEAQSLPLLPEYQTIYISGGKKNKLNRGDIAGFFIQKGKLDAADLGLIEVKDFTSFVAVRSTQVDKLLRNIGGEKMKEKKYKIEEAR